ncbi:MAG: ABC transporter ATP-binding protein [Thermoanaerobaculia bacterium]|nr:ABC transporter ATP-binding protein [Thermoanaerobaculia bacterium]
MIETNGLTLRYGERRALAGLDMTIPAGELFGLVGPNGSGKTSILRILATLVPQSSGSATVHGLDVRRAGSKVRRLVGYMPATLGLHENLTVAEYLEFFSAAYDIRPALRSTTVSGVMERTGLVSQRNSMIGELSRGMQQRIGLARILLHDPKVLLLDDPGSGLDPRFRADLRELFKELRSAGKTILIASHALSEIAGICSSIGILAEGRLLFTGTVADALERAGARPGVNVELDGEGERARDVLLQMPGIVAVEVRSPGSLTACFAPGRDLTGDVVCGLVSNGFRLRRLDPKATDLEEAYLRLTASGEQ